MFALNTHNSAVCLADYMDIKAGAIVPQVNELYQQVEAWIDEGNDFVDLPAEPPEIKYAAQLRALESARKTAEAVGVTVNGIRYSGSQSNRQALSEALQAATEFQITTFTSWKDSDGVYHSDHPVTDVHQAYGLIGQRRMALIAKEGELSVLIKNGDDVEVDLAFELIA